MTRNDFQRIEAELHLKLPRAYRELIGAFPEELRNWPDPMPPDVYDARDALLFDAAQIIKLTRGARKRLGRDFPAGGLIIGGKQGANCWMIDTTASEPPVQLVHTNDYILSGFERLAGLLSRIRDAHRQAWAKSPKSRPDQPISASLAPDDLIAEGRKLARPAVALYDAGKNYAALWRGKGVADPGPGEWRHWVSIDASFLPDNPRRLKGVISLYDWFADDDRMGEIKVVHNAAASLPRKTDGTKLFARSFDCIPDVDAVIRFGSKRIRNWAKSTGWESKPVYDQSPVKEYLEVVAAEHPFQNGDGAYAMLGGWSWCFNWCYGIDEKYPWNLMKKALIVLTIAESEPWIEVFDDGRKFVTFSRIT